MLFTESFFFQSLQMTKQKRKGFWYIASNSRRRLSDYFPLYSSKIWFLSMDTMQKSDYTMEYQMCAKYDKLRLITQDFRKKRAKNALNVGENDLEWILCPSTFDVFRSKEKRRMRNENQVLCCSKRPIPLNSISICKTKSRIPLKRFIKWWSYRHNFHALLVLSEYRLCSVSWVFIFVFIIK